MCGCAIVVTPAGQKFLESPKAWFLCNPCGLKATETLNPPR